MTKVCSKCKIEKDVSEFYKSRNVCKVCKIQASKEWCENNKERIKQKIKEWRENNKERVRQTHKEWRENNKERVMQIKKEWYENNKERVMQIKKEWRENNKERVRQTHKEWYENNKERRKVYKNSRYKTDLNYKISVLIRSSFKKALKLYSKNGKTQSMKEYGIDIKAIYEKLGDMPQDGKVYHVDHIFPVSAFDLNNPEHIKLCWHPDNLRWLEGKENMSKSDKYDEMLFEEYLKKVN